VVILEYDVHGKIVQKAVQLRQSVHFVITIENRKMSNGGTIWTR